MTTAEQFQSMVELMRIRRANSNAMRRRVAARNGWAMPASAPRVAAVTSAPKVTASAVPVAAVRVVPAAPRLQEPWLAEARKLRRAGWSLPGLAKRFGASQADVAAALGESHEKDW